MSTEIRVPIHSDVDIVTARQQGRALALQMEFSKADAALIATAISEVARNIISYAERGEVLLEPIEQGRRRGIRIVARDQGPGIADLELAMQDGFSTARGLGLGLPGARRLTDEFEIRSELGKGTVITMICWVK